MILLKDVSLECSVWLCIALGTNHSFFMGGVGGSPAANNFLVCFRLPANTFFFLHTIYFSVYSPCKQFMSTFSNSPLPSQKNTGPSLIILVLFSIDRYISRKVLNAQARGLHLVVSNYSLWIIVHHGLARKGLDPSVIGNITSWCHHVRLGDWA